MRLYHAYYNWEVQQESGSAIILFPTLSEARSRSIELLKDEMAERVANEEKYQSDPRFLDADILTADIKLVEVVPINVRSLCSIINSGGGGYVRDEKDVLKISLPARAKRPVIERVK